MLWLLQLRQLASSTLPRGSPVDTGACLNLAWHLGLFGRELLGVSATPTKPQTKALPNWPTPVLSNSSTTWSYLLGSTVPFHRVVSMISMVQTSPTLIPLSRQKLFQPPTSWPQFWYRFRHACQDLVLLVEVLSVIMQRCRNPIALQKGSGKFCKNCSHM